MPSCFAVEGRYWERWLLMTYPWPERKPSWDVIIRWYPWSWELPISSKWSWTRSERLGMTKGGSLRIRKDCVSPWKGVGALADTTWVVRWNYVRMKSFYLFLSSQDSWDLFPHNTPSEWRIQLPKPYTLEGRWECSVIDITLDCNFTPRSSRLYLCCDFVEDSYVRGKALPVLKNLELTGRYKKVKYESFLNPTYIPVKTAQLRGLRFYTVGADLTPVVFSSNELHCVLHFRWVP